MLCNRNNDCLNRCNGRRKNKAVVVAVSHNNSADKSCRCSPRCLIRSFKSVVLIHILNFKCLCKAVAEIVRGSRLQCLTVVHKCLDGICVLCARKSLFFGLNTLNYGHSKHVFTEIGIDVEHFNCFSLSFLCRCVNCMSLLPKKFSCAEERSCGLFPTDNRHPLIVELRQITVRMDNLLVVFAEKCFRRRTNAKSLLKLFASAVCYPCNLGSKALNVILFLFEETFGDEHRHTNIFMSRRLEH